MTFARNNLDKAISPYLRQHIDNPVWWQEWSAKALAHAQKEGKPLFVSVGYATCHWCHVMAGESFQDPEVADELNRNFVAIKVDREQRPDIDSYLMAFITAQSGQGGWPLNCFLSPEMKPIFALTYAPARSAFGRPGLLEILRKVKEYHDRARHDLQPFNPPVIEPAGGGREGEIVEALWEAFDQEAAGFGPGAKFPPHCTLLFLLYAYPSLGAEKARVMLERTLDAMLMRGLHDHLQGGFFRYCVDRAWTIPHFEKMLYDQAMLLWAYSLACRVLGKASYRAAVDKLLACLEGTFAQRGLYCSGHDADTGHEEGATYLWDEPGLREALTAGEYRAFAEVYAVSPQGNFEGKTHLIRRKDVFLEKIEQKLLAQRRKRAQPAVDDKVVTSWNCLLGIALVHAHRHAGRPEALEKALKLLERLLEEHFKDGKLIHSSCGGRAQEGQFLQDYAALFLFLTYLHEETGRFEEELRAFYAEVLAFKKDGRWWEAFNEDFLPVPADGFDHPTPSSVSLARLALARADVFLGLERAPGKYHRAFYSDFANVAALFSNGLFHIIDTPEKIAWDQLPVNALQRPGPRILDCYQGACREALPAR